MKRLHKYFETILVAVLTLCVFTCAAGETLSLPADLQRVEEEAFANCENLKGVLVVPLDAELDPTAFTGAGDLDIIRGVAVVGDEDTPWDGSLSADVRTAVSSFCENRGISFTYTTDAAAAVSAGYNIVITAGFQASGAVEELQFSCPDVRFICLDTSVENRGDNVYAVTYDCFQAGFMAGYAAVMEGYRSLGFMGGMQFGDVVDYGQGFVSGANQAAVNEGITDEVSVAYTYTGVFSPEDSVYETASAWYNSGVEIIFSAGGDQGVRVNQAALERNRKMIGVDTDQRSIYDTVRFSAVKRLGYTAVDALSRILAGGWAGLAGRQVNLGLVNAAPAENYVGLAPVSSWDASTVSALMSGTWPSGEIQITVYEPGPAVRCVGVVLSELIPDEGTMDYDVMNAVSDFCLAKGIDVDFSTSVRGALNEGCDVVITVGFGFTEDVHDLQYDYEGVRFICLDTEIEDPYYNVYSVTYDCYRAGFMAGYAAVKMGYRSLGFLGGVAVPEVVNYGQGFVRGASQAAVELGIQENVSVVYGYANTFAPDDIAYDMADGWYENGTEIIFSCGGSICEKVIQAANENGKKMIGVDTDQSGLGTAVVTSAVKNVGFTVVDALTRVLNGEWDGMGGRSRRLGVVSETPADNHVCLGGTRFNASFTAADYAALVGKLLRREYPFGDVLITVTGDYAEPESIDVGISMPTSRMFRWQRDGVLIRDAVEAGGLTASLMYANNDAETQAEQIWEMIDNGCQTLIIAPVYGPSLGAVLTRAAAEGIIVISYDRLLMNTDNVDYYLTFNNVNVGAVQANYIIDALGLDNGSGPFTLEITAGDLNDWNGVQFYQGALDVLRPYINQGKLAVRSGQTDLEDVSTEGWNPENARERAAAILDAYYTDTGRPDAWLCVNDSTAEGVIAALEGRFTGGWPVITGQDCDIYNVKCILAGKQSMSVFKDTAKLAAAAAEMAGQALAGEPVTVDDTTSFDNNNKVVPARLIDPDYVDAVNLEAVLIGGGIYTREQLGLE